MSQSILKMEQIVKSFGAVNVLKGVDFDLAKGEVHALVGGNGAGKSTLMKIMTGVYTKDSGKIIIKGEEKEIKSTNDAKENGIAMIFQEMSLVPSLTIAENIFLGYELKKHGMRDVKLMKQETEKVLKRLGLDLDPGTPVSELSVGLCQMVEIAKAVSKNASILVFDEPSAALSDSETEFLFKMIRQLKEKAYPWFIFPLNFLNGFGSVINLFQIRNKLLCHRYRFCSEAVLPAAGIVLLKYRFAEVFRTIS